jgi:hypothetical protein
MEEKFVHEVFAFVENHMLSCGSIRKSSGKLEKLPVCSSAANQCEGEKN